MPNARRIPHLTIAPRAWGRSPVSKRGLVGLLAAALVVLGPAAPALLADAASSVPTVSVGDRVWVDRNGNGLQDSGEPGIRGVYVTLTTASGSAVTDVNGRTVGGARTDGGGYYSFDDLPAGRYVVHIDNNQVDLRDYKPTQAGVGGDRGQDSSTGSAQSADLQNNGDRDGTLDFGFTADNPRVMLSMNPSAVKDLDGNGPDAGDTIRYEFVVTNTGNTPLSSFAITSPMGLAGLSCPAATLQPGEKLECAPTTYTLTQADIDRGYVDGDSTVTARTPDGGTVSDRDCPVTDATARAVSVGDFVWLDVDKDGVQDAGEPGISGVVVSIVGPDGRAVRDIYGDPVGTRTTDADGRYVFAKLPALPVGQHYTVRVDNGQPALSGYTPTRTGQGTRATDSSNGSAESTDLNRDGASDLTLDFGFTRPTVSVGDFVWVDIDGDGVQDSDEPGIRGVQVTLVGPNGQAVRDVTGAAVGPNSTDADGKYTFANLPALPAGQHYTVRVDNTQAALRDFTPTIAGAGGDRAKDSSTGSAESSDLTADGDSDTTLDFGYTLSGPGIKLDKIAGPVVDLDANGPDAGDTITYTFKVTNIGKQTLTNVTIADPKVGPVTCPTTPLAAGASVSCSSVTYTLTVADVRAGKVVNTATVTGTAPDGRKVTDDDSTTTPVVPRSVSVGDFVWVDSDRDGVQDSGEPGLKGVVLTIVGPDGQPVRDVRGDVVGPQTTDAAGAYLFDRLPALPAGQHYTVRVDNAQAALAGFVPTQTGQGTRATDSSTGSAESADLVDDGAFDPTLDFGFVTDKPAIQLDKVASAIDDVDGNGPDAGDRITYQFKVTNIGSVPLNPVTVADPKVGPVTCAAGALASGASRFCTAVTYTLTAADITAGAVNNTATAEGTAPDGTKVTDSDSTSTPVTPAAVSVGDFVWIDTDRDGVQDAGEPGLAGVVVTIVGPNGQAVTGIDGVTVGPETTDANGAYSFDGLPALPAGQHYTVKVDKFQAALAGYVSTVAGAGNDPTKDSSTDSAESVDLTKAGDRDATLDFGFVKPAVSVGDFVWLDTNRDGLQDSGEPGIPGVTVTLVGPNGQAVTGVDGQPVAPGRTDANGAYSFTGLPPLPAGQGYTVRIDNTQPALAAYTPTTAGVGSDRALDSSTGSATSGDLTSNGDRDPSLDFGFVSKADAPVVSVGDFVWNDTDRDGIQDPGEPGIPGVTLTIVGPNGQPVTGVDGQTVGPQVTNAQGAYSFTNLPALAAGQSYTVRVDNAQAALAGLTPTTAGAGTDRAVDSSTGSAASGDLTGNGDRDPSLDFGFISAAATPSVSVGDFVWSDTDRDGIQDAGEPGIQGVVLTIVGPGGQAVTNVDGIAVGPATTDANGRYTFDRLPVLPAGQHYTVRIDNAQAALANRVPTTAGAGADRALDSSTGSAESRDLTAGGQSDTSLDFGFVGLTDGPSILLDKQAGAINDLDGNGPDAGDTITYTFLVSNTGNVPLNPVTVTDPKVGAVTCPAGALAPGATVACSPVTYTLVANDIAAGSVQNTATATGKPPTGPDVTDDDSTSTPVTPGSIGKVSVGDFVWVDTDRDGVQDAGEPGIPGVTVTIVGPTGQPVAGVGPQVTNAQGAYAFTNLPALPAGQHYTVRIDNGQAALAGYVPTVSGQGTRATDSSNGSAESGDLAVDGASDTTLDFGFVTPTTKPAVSVGDFVWVDANGNGVQDSGERGLAGVVLTIVGPNGQPVTNVDGLVVGPVSTDANGAYAFTGLPVLPAGQHYTVRVDNGQAALSAFNPTQTGQGTRATDSSNGSAESADLTTAGATDTTLDFGFVPKAGTQGVSVGDFLWVDANRNGVQDAGERGLAGVTVTLVGPNGQPVTDINGALVGPKVTDVNGAYSFTNLPTLPAGQHYTVRVDNTQAALAGFRPTVTGQGTRATDSSDGSAESGDLTTGGATDTTLDFGFVPVGDGTAAILIDKRASAIDDVDANGSDAGDTITYTFVVTNVGDRPLEQVAVVDTKVGAVLCPATTLAVGASMTCTAAPYVITPADVAAGTVDNKATVTGVPTPTVEDPDPAPVGDDDETSTPVTTPDADIVLDKSVSGFQDVDGNGASAGDLITYTFTVINTSSVTISDITVTDPKVGTVTCPATTLAAGAQMTCTAAPYVVTTADIAAGSVNNTAVVDGKTPDGTPVTDDDETTTDLTDEPGPTPPTPDPGDVNGYGGFFNYLPSTGGPAGVLLWVAAGALVLGGILLVRSRRRA